MFGREQRNILRKYLKVTFVVATAEIIQEREPQVERANEVIRRITPEVSPVAQKTLKILVALNLIHSNNLRHSSPRTLHSGFQCFQVTDEVVGEDFFVGLGVGFEDRAEGGAVVGVLED